MGRVVIRCDGVPRPGGSKRALPNRRTGGLLVVDDSRHVKQWRQAVRVEAVRAAHAVGHEPFNGAVAVDMLFLMPRPVAHYHGRSLGGQLRPAARNLLPVARPDVLKLARAVEDALTGVIWRDDALIVTELLRKRFAEDRPPGVVVTVVDGHDLNAL
jgi:crossover junction endodeoxyribonuclease RusA